MIGASRFLTGLVTHAMPGFAPGGPQPPILPPKDGLLFLDRDKFHAVLVADVPADLAGSWPTRRSFIFALAQSGGFFIALGNRPLGRAVTTVGAVGLAAAVITAAAWLLSRG